ncbi:hypothetical protein ABEB36_009336 [Hypothenemus hampei]|uniref:Uncharacterized protein n=1 Tax=Hypothenemus hampei TaxID=57062 RepID=A0ABD1EK71_HYPHA
MPGHSYLECDRDIGLEYQKIAAELPQHWISELKSCRVKPTSFDVNNFVVNLVTTPLLSREKFRDLQHLKKFCGPEAQKFFEKLPN